MSSPSLDVSPVSLYMNSSALPSNDLKLLLGIGGHSGRRFIYLFTYFLNGEYFLRSNIIPFNFLFFNPQDL